MSQASAVEPISGKVMAFARSQAQPADENAAYPRELKALGVAKPAPAAGNQRRYAFATSLACSKNGLRLSHSRLLGYSGR